MARMRIMPKCRTRFWHFDTWARLIPAEGAHHSHLVVMLVGQPCDGLDAGKEGRARAGYVVYGPNMANATVRVGLDGFEAFLFNSAKAWSDRAVGSFSKGDLETASHHASVALEHLLKARLVGFSALLVADPRDLDTLLHLGGSGHLAITSFERIRTIGVGEAAKRARRFIPGWRYSDGELDPLISTRNGVAHAGLWAEADARDGFLLFLRAVRMLFAASPQGESEFWGSASGMVDAHLAEATSELRLALATKIEAARHKFEARISGLTAQARDAVLAAAEAIPPFWSDHDEQHECPACGRLGWLGGLVQVEMDRGWEEADGHEYSVPGMVFFPDTFKCSVCGLELDYDELGESDIPMEIDQPDMEVPDDLWEPDEDWVRGR